MKTFTAWVACLFVGLIAMAGEHVLEFKGKDGPGKGKTIVLISGDEEYRSEEAMPLLAKILSQHHGFDCKVLFAWDNEGSYIDPNNQAGIRGWEELKTADLMIIGTRFRRPTAEDAQHLTYFMNAGKPIIGMRTSTHGFVGGGRFGGKIGYTRWGKHVLGVGWDGHHGRHKAQGARGVIEDANKNHPILRGVTNENVFAPSDVYRVRGLQESDLILLRGAVTETLDPSSPNLNSEKNNPMQPSSWLRPYVAPNGTKGTSFCTTMGASVDLVSEGLRRIIVNAAFYLNGLEVPPNANVAYVDPFYPTFYGFIKDTTFWPTQNKTAADFGLGKSPSFPDPEGTPKWDFRQRPPMPVTAATPIAQESQPQVAVSVHLDEEQPFRAAEAGFEISRNDLLSGVRFQSNLKLQSGSDLGMTDGSGGHRIFAAPNEQGDPWVVEFSDLRIQRLEEIRVFSWNRDTRARQDYDVALSSDGGSTWQPVANKVTAKKNGVLAVTRVVAPFDAVTNLRFTFRQVRNNTHSAILEIDALGEKIPVPTIEELRSEGKKFSKYLDPKALAVPDGPPEANLTAFQHEIKPLLEASCVKCHGPDKQKGKFRVDTLDPDMINGEDGAWWVEVTDTISQGEMPPPDEEDVELADADRAKVVDWISQELLVASQARRSEQGHTSFRRLTRYETSYALQDLLGLPYDFARDLPPETESEDGFQNSSEMLQMTSAQFETYREIAHTALSKATVRGEQPEPVRYAITAESAEANFQARRLSSIEKLRKKTDADSQAKLAEEEKVAWTYDANKAHFVNLETGRGFPSRSGYGRNSFRPLEELPETPEVSNYVLALPGNTQQLLDFGDFLPGSGTLRLRVRAWQSSTGSPSNPDLRINFGYQPSNNSKTSFRVGEWPITSTSDSPEFYEMDIHLGEISRNAYRGKHPLGKRPNPSEYLVFQNLSSSGIHIDYIEVTAPHYDQWPPESHQQVFADGLDPEVNPRKILSDFMRRAWRRPATEAELDKKLALFNAIRPSCDDAQQAMLEVLATVISSPNFLYIVQSPEPENFDLATRLAMFLWSSVPDEELLKLAEAGRLSDPDTLAKQVDRMLADERSERFSHHFVRQWLGLALLDYQEVEPNLRKAMGQEPIELFAEMLRQDSNILDFLHSDYTMLNEKLANHYGIKEVFGSEFRRVDLQPESRRGGILTQAGLLAMNADGKHSHPLKRGIWLLENILHDPPPPPPPAVPEIDLADPKILKMTLKERMADHRDDPACASCHEKIDPWGIAFENYDALGKWRSEDSVGVLFNGDKLQGMDGLKRYLLELRQDQFASAMTHKLTSYALGRPISFGDRTSLEQITAKTRREGDGLKTLIRNIILSNLFQP